MGLLVDLKGEREQRRWGAELLKVSVPKGTEHERAASFRATAWRFRKLLRSVAK